MPSPASHPHAERAQQGERERVRLRDGSWVTVREVHPQDEAALRCFLSDLCLDARRLRFFSAAIDIAQAAHLGAEEDAAHRGLVARDETGLIVGHATYALLDEQRAEVAVEVSDHLHSRGLGTVLLERLARLAEQRGVTRFVAEVLSENRAMLEVFRDGFDAHVTRHEGTQETIEFSTSGWRLAKERFPLRTSSTSTAP